MQVEILVPGNKLAHAHQPSRAMVGEALEKRVTTVSTRTAINEVLNVRIGRKWVYVALGNGMIIKREKGFEVRIEG